MTKKKKPVYTPTELFEKEVFKLMGRKNVPDIGKIMSMVNIINTIVNDKILILEKIDTRNLNIPIDEAIKALDILKIFSNGTSNIIELIINRICPTPKT